MTMKPAGGHLPEFRPNSMAQIEDDSLQLMAPPAPGVELEQHSISSILSPPLARILQCFAQERPSQLGIRTERRCRLFQALERPLGKTHLLVHLLRGCLLFRVLYFLVAIGMASSLGLKWLQSTLLLASSLLSFGLISFLSRLASFSWTMDYRIMDRFVRLKLAAQSRPQRASGTRVTLMVGILLVAFCFYLWSISTSTELLLHAGFYDILLVHDHSIIGNRSSEADILGGNVLSLLLAASTFGNAMLCGLAIAVHLLVAHSVFRSFKDFVDVLIERIVTRQISREKELHALMCRSDNLLRFVLFTRRRFSTLGWLAFLVTFTVNLSVIALFWQLNIPRLRNLLIFANKVSNNLLGSFLVLSSASVLGIYIYTLKMDFRLEYVRRLFTLENSFPNPISPETQRLAQALLERLEQANSHQTGLHRLQLLFAIQFFHVFAIIGIFNSDLTHIVLNLVYAIVTIIGGLSLYVKSLKLLKYLKSKFSPYSENRIKLIH